MSNQKRMLGVVVLSLMLCVFASIPAIAGSAVVGSVAGSMNTTISGQAVPPGYTILSGDSLKVQDGSAVLAVGKGSRMVFGRYSNVTFERDSQSISARMTSGDVSLFRPTDDPNALRVLVGNVTIEPAGGYKTLGEVALLNDVVVVSAKQGLVKVSWPDGKTTDVPAGKALKLAPKNGRAPQAAGGSQHYGTDWDKTLDLIGAGVGVVAAILAGIAIEHANDATNAANEANQNALAAIQAAQNAENASNAAFCAILAAWNKSFPPASQIQPPSGISCGS